MTKLTINGCARACLALAAAVAASIAGAAATLDVTGEATYTDANIDELSNYDAVNLANAASKLTINIASDATISCLVTNKGSVVKQGAGALSLSNNSLREGFNAQAGWRIEAGAVALPPVNSTSGNGYKLTNLYIEKDAQLRLCPVANVSHGLNFAGGEGMVTNASTTASVSLPDDQRPGMSVSGTFAGVFGPNIKYGVNYLAFTFTGVNLCGGNTEGVNGTTFSVGSGDALGNAYQFMFNDNNSWLKYIGEGGTTFGKRFVFASNKVGGGFSGGDHGGLTIDSLDLFIGNYVRDVYFAGDGGTNVLQSVANKGKISGAASRLVKTGACAWWFKHDRERYLRGGSTEVREGKLIIDALFDKGEICALGVGTNVAKIVTSATVYSEDLAVPYGVLLSGGELEFIGSTNAAYAADRGIGVSADSKLTDNGQNVVFGFDGVQNVGEAAHTLTLGGTSACSRLDNVKDGEDGGKLSLAKVGNGTWTLAGDQTFSGTLDVREGTVRVLNDGDKTKFTYFRIHVTESGMSRFGSKNGSPVQISHWGLFDAEGNRLGRQVVDAPTFGNGNLQTNEIGWARDTELYDHTNNPDTGTPQGMFNEADYRYYRKEIPNVTPTLAYPTSWQRIAVRLPDDIAEVTSYDIVTPSMTSATRMVCSWIVDGSVDGLHWTQLDEQQCNPGVTNRTSASNWVYDDSAFVKYNTSTKNVEATKHKGFPITAKREAKAYSQLANATVRVAPGATLVADGDVTLSSVAVADAAAGMGAISGFRFAESGVFTIENMPKSGATFAKAITDATDAANIAKWSVSVNGKVNANYSLRVRADGTISVSPKGLLLIVR